MAPTGPYSAERTAGRLSLAVSLAFYTALAFAFRNYTPDDTFIFLRYAENLASGHGPVFTTGERVQGFTSPLWTLTLAGAAAAGLNVLAFAKLAGACLGASCIVFAYVIGRHVGATVAVAAPIITAGFLDIPYWAISGMDASLFAAACSLGLLLTIRASGTGSIAAAAGAWSVAALTRPEGVMFGVLALAWLFYVRRPRRVQGLAALAVFLLPLAAWAAFAFMYYGDVIPTTYWAKRLDRWTALHKALALLRAFLVSNDAALIALASLAALWHPARRTLSVLAAFVSLNIAYILWTGGDSWASPGVFRFSVAWLVPLSVVMAAGASVVFDRMLAAGRPNLARLTAVVTAGAWLLFPSTSTLVIRPVGGDPAIVSHLNTHSAFDDVIAVNDIGQFGYFTGLPVLDIYGLVDPWIARELRKNTPWSYYPADARRLVDHVLDREPRWVILKGQRNREQFSIAPESIGPELFSDPRFAARYRFVMAGTAEPFLLFERQDNGGRP